MPRKIEKMNTSKTPLKQLKANAKNELIKRKYFHYQKETQGLSEKTIEAIQKAIYRYEDFTDFEEFSKFNKKRAVEFKKWIEEKKNPQTAEPLAVSTVYYYLRHLQDFFKWLCCQPGYKSKINRTDVDYLKLSKEKARMAIQSKRERFPTLEQVQKVVNSIEINSELDLRDRALICFTLLSGMRDSAIISLPLECFDVEKLQVDQNPKKGVKTKFKKTFKSYLLPFDKDMLNHVLEWVKHLKEEKLFGNADPMFPKNKVENAENSKVFSSNSVEPYFWHEPASMRKIFKQRFEAVGIEYFQPHTFRHLAVNLATKKCKDGFEYKAVSQNFGHEHIGTTMMTYGSLNNFQLAETIRGIDFEGSENMDLDQFEQFKQFQEFQRMQRKDRF